MMGLVIQVKNHFTAVNVFEASHPKVFADDAKIGKNIIPFVGVFLCVAFLPCLWNVVNGGIGDKVGMAGYILFSFSISFPH